MPYIKTEDRASHDLLANEMNEYCVGCGDDLVYVLFWLCSAYTTPSYNNYKAFISELQLCAREIRRRNNLDRRDGIYKRTYFNVDRVNQWLDALIEKAGKDYSVKPDGHLNYTLFAYCKRHFNAKDKAIFAARLEEAAEVISRVLLDEYEQNDAMKRNGDVE